MVSSDARVRGRRRGWRRWRRASAGIAAAAALGAGVEPGRAAPDLLAAPELAHLAAAAPVAGWRLLPDGPLWAAWCGGGSPIARDALALTTRPPSRREAERCAASPGAGEAGAPLTVPLGREAVYLVARETDWAPPRSRDLYLALAAEVPAGGGAGAGLAPNPARRWREVSAELPDAGIRVLLPAPGRPPRELFARTVLEAGCGDLPAIRAIFDPSRRARACVTVRGDAAVVLAGAGTDPFAWLAGQPPYAVAIVAQPDIARMADELVVLPLDGVAPTYPAVGSGAYGASWTVYLSLPPGTDPARSSAHTAALALAAESSLGPAGALAAAGLAPLPAAERVALRSRLLDLGGS